MEAQSLIDACWQQHGAVNLHSPCSASSPVNQPTGLSITGAAMQLETSLLGSGKALHPQHPPKHTFHPALLSPHSLRLRSTPSHSLSLSCSCAESTQGLSPLVPPHTNKPPHPSLHGLPFHRRSPDSHKLGPVGKMSQPCRRDKTRGGRAHANQ